MRRMTSTPTRPLRAPAASASAAPRLADADSDAAGGGSSAEASSAAAATLEQLRARLADGPDFSEFVGGGSAARRGGAVDPKTGRDAEQERANSKRKDPPKPAWLKIQTPTGAAAQNFRRLQDTVRELNLATVCEEAKCPNQTECWGGADGTATATIMIMGDTCTRGCSFCNVKTSNAPPPLDAEEPRKVARAIADWGLDYVVLTSVDRDDLSDQGSEHFASTVRHLKKMSPDILVECLTPDFRDDDECIERVAASGLDVYAHNLETVRRMTPRVRDRRAAYGQSLSVLRKAKAAVPRLITKTSLMLGVGETEAEIRETMADCLDAGVDVITFGQYLRPSSRHLPVAEYVTPESFAQWEEVGKEMGFLYVASGPLVRSSYRAGELFLKGMIERRKANPLA